MPADGRPQDLADAFVPLDAGVDIAADIVADSAADLTADAMPDLAPVGPSPCARAPGDNPVRNGRRDFLDMTITAVDFAEHEGKRVYVFTREYNQKTPLGYGSAVVQMGAFQLQFPAGYARFSYQPIFFFVDVNGDGRCDEATGDHAGYVTSSGWNPAANEPLTQRLEHGHDTQVRGERICDVLNACR